MKYFLSLALVSRPVYQKEDHPEFINTVVDGDSNYP